MSFLIWFEAYPQTTSDTINPDWTADGDWTGTAPSDGSKTNQDAILDHNSNISFDFEIIHTVTINSGKTLTTDKKIIVDNGGILIINGTVRLTNEVFEIKEGGAIIVNNGGVLQGDANEELKVVKGDLTVNSGGSINWTGDWSSNDNPSNITIDGSVTVGGDFSNKVDITGSGNINVSGTVNNDGGTIFGCTDSGSSCCPGGSCSSSVLPVELLSFEAHATGSGVELLWSTATEENFEYFSVQRSQDAFQWNEIGRVNGGGDSEARRDYSFIDQNPLDGTSYYRLQSVDFDDYTEIFDAVSVFVEAKNHFLVYPSVVSGALINLDYHPVAGRDPLVRILDLSGRTQFEYVLAGKGLIPIPGGLPNAIYFIELIDGSNVNRAKIIVSR